MGLHARLAPSATLSASGAAPRPTLEDLLAELRAAKAAPRVGAAR